ncbi:hypothetical protein B0H11DRAFT_1741388, partial [Mycena galericulata]
SSTLGTTLVSGIQDISSFLPILGTDQCETHVGESLSAGFLYAAATPLSIFGCLGIIKASLAILWASLSPKTAQMLTNTGFSLQGSGATMIGSAPSQEEQHPSNDKNIYLADWKFQEFLKSHHMDKMIFMAVKVHF